MVKRFQIQISHEAYQALLEIARRERRRPVDQAGWILEKVLLPSAPTSLEDSVSAGEVRLRPYVADVEEAVPADL
jgi:hypothetical protein